MKLPGGGGNSHIKATPTKQDVGVLSKISEEHPRLFYMEVPPPPVETNANVWLETVKGLQWYLTQKVVTSQISQPINSLASLHHCYTTVPPWNDVYFSFTCVFGKRRVHLSFAMAQLINCSSKMQTDINDPREIWFDLFIESYRITDTRKKVL